MSNGESALVKPPPSEVMTAKDLLCKVGSEFIAVIMCYIEQADENERHLDEVKRASNKVDFELRSGNCNESDIHAQHEVLLCVASISEGREAFACGVARRVIHFVAHLKHCLRALKRNKWSNDLLACVLSSTQELYVNVDHEDLASMRIKRHKLFADVLAYNKLVLDSDEGVHHTPNGPILL